MVLMRILPLSISFWAAYWLHWAALGYNVFAVDTCGQNGETPDNNPYATGAILGCMTRGLVDPATYYYRFARQLLAKYT